MKIKVPLGLVGLTGHWLDSIGQAPLYFIQNVPQCIHIRCSSYFVQQLLSVIHGDLWI